MGCCDTVPRYWMSDPPARIMNIKHHENPATGLAPVSWTLYWCYWGPLTSLHRLGLSPPSCRHSPTCIEDLRNEISLLVVLKNHPGIVLIALRRPSQSRSSPGSRNGWAFTAEN